MEHLFLAAIASLPKWDKIFRRRLSKVVPNLRELRESPRQVLSAEEIVIGPGTRVATSIFLGLIVGLMLTCGIFLSLADEKELGGKKRTLEERVTAIAGFAMPVVAIVAFLRILRGGTLLLNADGVFFTLRRQTVVCPWALFDVPESPVEHDDSTMVLPTNPDAVPDVQLVFEESLTESGLAVRTKQFRFRLPTSAPVTNDRGLPEIALRDLYRVRIEEIAWLLMDVGRRMNESNNER